MSRTIVPALAFAITAMIMANPSAGSVPCADLLPDASHKRTAMRSITAEDLVELRDIGPVSSGNPRAQILSLSPDGSQMAFQVRKADIASNSYCLGMAVMDLRSGAVPRIIDSGGEYLKVLAPFQGYAENIPGGMAAVITPKWSPDGQWIAYLRRDNGVTQLWRARTDGGGAMPVTNGNYDIEAFGWLSNNDVIVAGRPDLVKAREAVMAEGKSGYRYDERFVPVSSSTPQPREPISRDYSVIDLKSGESRNAQDFERLSLTPEKLDGVPTGAVLAKVYSNKLAWLAADDPENITATVRLTVRNAHGARVTCKPEACADVIDFWLTGQDEFTLLRRSPGKSRMQLVRWKVGGGGKTVLDTEDVLMGCQSLGASLICGYERSTQPRRVVEINVKSGAVQTLFDPNPEFNQIRFGQVERLHWQNRFGIETFADLVLPPDHISGQKHPLVVVQYESRGFLRGGTGDEYPVHLLAAKGFAVLSFQRPLSVGLMSGAKTWPDVNRMDRVDWADRRSVLSSLEIGVRRVISLGVVEPDKIGLTGLSDGASSVQFALINSTMFAAAAVSGCCDEGSVVAVLVGPAFSQWYAQMGYPSVLDRNEPFWKPVSFVQSATKIRTPLLIQAADREYLGALEGYTALKAANAPVEMYVFPDEYHIKWQPVHRLASYNRSLDWFTFWLKGMKSSDPAKASQYVRWHALGPR